MNKNCLHNAGLAFLWLLFMIFFAYTDFIESFMRVDFCLGDSHSESQHTNLNMLVNWGMVIMLVFDLKSVKDTYTFKDIVIPVIALALAFLLKTHSHLCFISEICKYKAFFSSHYFAYIVHCLFLALLFYMKLVILNASDKIGCTELKNY